MAANYREKPNISHSPSDSRKHYRLTNTLNIQVEGVVYKTSDWSVSACKIGEYAGSLQAGDETVASFEFRFQDFSSIFNIKIKVLRQEDDELVFEYIDENPRKLEAISYFSKGIVSGELQDFEDFIRHIDIPITDNYIQETFKEEEKAHPTRNFFVVFSVIAGIIALLFMGKSVYTNFNLLPVDSAVVSVKTSEINSPSRGILSDIYVEEGMYIAPGEPLFKVLNTRIEKEIELKKNEILKNKALLKEKRQKLYNLQSRLTSYKQDISLKLDVQEKVIESISGKIDILNAELTNKEKLYKKQFISKPEIDVVKREILRQEQLLSEANYEYFLAYSSYKDPERAISSVNINRYQNTDNLKAEIQRVTEFITIEEQELDYIKSANYQNVVKVPFKAFVKKIYAFEGKYVDEKTPVVFLKDVSSGKKLVEACITEAEALKLRIGIETKISIPSQKLELKGVLVSLEKRQENWGKNLVIAVIKPDTPERLEEVSDETPAKVVFVRNKILQSPLNFVFSGAN